MSGELIELNDILEELGEPPTTLEELRSIGLFIVPLTEVGGVETVEVRSL